MGREGQITVDGSVATFRDYIAEKTELDGSIAEHALAHKLKDKSVAAYQRGAMMDKRRLMMQRYGNYAYQTGEDLDLVVTSIYARKCVLKVLFISLKNVSPRSSPDLIGWTMQL